MSQHVFADGFGHTPVKADVVKVRHRDIRQELEDLRERREWISNQRQAHMISVRPFAVASDRLDDYARKIFTRQILQQISFGKEGIIQNGLDQLRIFGDKQGACDTARSAARQCDLFAARDSLKLLQDRVFRGYFDFRGKCRSLSDPHEIEQVEEFQQGQGNKPRRLGMAGQRQLQRIASADFRASGDLTQNLSRQVPTPDETEQVPLREVGVPGERNEDLFRGLSGKTLEFTCAGRAGFRFTLGRPVMRIAGRHPGPILAIVKEGRKA